MEFIPGNTRRVPRTGIGTSVQKPEPHRNRHFDNRNRTGTANLLPDPPLNKTHAKPGCKTLTKLATADQCCKKWGSVHTAQCIRFRKKVHSGHSQITKIQYSLQILHKIVYSKSLLKNWYTLGISRKMIFYAQNSKSAAHWAVLFCSSPFGPCTFKAGSFLAELFWCRDQLRSYFLNIYFNSYYSC